MSNKRYGEWAQPPEPIDENKITQELRCEALIIGAGIAGVSCAFRAAQCGLNVLVLEKGTTWSGRGGNVGVVGSSFMKSQGYENDPQEIAREWIKRCGNRCDERILWQYINNSPRAMDWLIDIITKPEYNARPALQGSYYKGETYIEYPGSHRIFDGPMAKKGMRAGGADAVYAMYCEAEKLGVRFLFETPASQLIVRDGAVIGAFGKTQDGYVRVLAERGVVLATGDIGGNDEMCEDLAPLANRCAAKIYWPKDGNMGDGHRMGLWAGGVFEDGPFPTILHPQAYHYRNYCSLFVKPDGTRFMNEDNYVQGKTVAILRERITYAWSILDADWKETVPKTIPYGGGLFWGADCEIGESEFEPETEEKTMESGIKRGVVIKADTPRELAEGMGVDADIFDETLRRYNELAATGKDSDFGKRAELLFPLEKAPFYALKFGPALLAVAGGLKVNSQMKVIGKDGDEIRGLYAIGNTAGGRYGVDYPVIIPGNSHGTALTFGMLLGEILAE